LANPFGLPVGGRDQVEEAGRRAAANYRDGKAIEFENFAKCVTDDLGYILEIERFEAKVGGSEHITPVALRVTSVFRREDGNWQLVHRHADPITSTRPARSVLQA
jgi:ketosteroid isomerase-like protein